MIHHTNIKRLRVLASAGLLLLATVAPVLLPQSAYAAVFTDRSLTLELDSNNAGTDEGSTPGGSVAHQLDFRITDAAGSFQSIKFLYCTTADVNESNCTTPTGLVTTSASLHDQVGVTGATLTNTTNGAPYISWGAGQNPDTSGTPGYTDISYTLGQVTNPTGNNETFFIRVLAYSNNDGTGSIVNSGTVAASTARPIVLTGVMPESLVFCAAATINAPGGIPDCTSATVGAVSFNQLFSSTDVAYATSQLSASTNASSGYVISVNGDTLTSGSYTIPAMAAATTSTLGTGQFGMNLVANTTPAVGADISSASNGTNLRGQPQTGYDTADNFKFVSGDTIADSGDAVLGPTDAQIYTVSYIVNVAGSQAPGTYTTTLQYICTPTF